MVFLIKIHFYWVNTVEVGNNAFITYRTLFSLHFLQTGQNWRHTYRSSWAPRVGNGFMSLLMLRPCCVGTGGGNSRESFIFVRGGGGGVPHPPPILSRAVSKSHFRGGEWGGGSLAAGSFGTEIAKIFEHKTLEKHGQEQNFFQTYQGNTIENNTNGKEEGSEIRKGLKGPLQFSNQHSISSFSRLILGRISLFPQPGVPLRRGGALRRRHPAVGHQNIQGGCEPPS